MNILATLLAAAIMLAPDVEPQKGDDAVVLTTEFASVEDAMDYVTREVLLPMDIMPLRYDFGLGYLVTERVNYQGEMNCDYTFVFSSDRGNILIKIRPRDYSNSRSLDTYTDYSMQYRPGAMKGSPALGYWDMFTAIVSRIPSVKVNYYSRTGLQ